MTDRPTLARQLIQYFNSRDSERFEALLAEDATLELPFTPQGLPSRFPGKDQMSRHFRRIKKMFSQFELRINEAFDCPERGAVVLSMVGAGWTPSGAPYRNQYAVILTFRDGHLASWREFLNPYVPEALRAPAARSPQA